MEVQRNYTDREPRKRTTSHIWAFTALALVGIWVAVLLASFYAPDFVSGSQQEHLPLAGWLDWLWGAVASSFVVLTALKGVRSAAPSQTPWIALALVSAGIWVAVYLVSVLAPVFVTGADPTRIPVLALVVPIVGVFLTWFVCAVIKSGFDRRTG
jgi:hypothetical protein